MKHELGPLPMQDLGRDNLYGYTADQMHAYAAQEVAKAAAELSKDAERYRILRNSDNWPAVFNSHDAPEPLRTDELDAAIDAAMERT